MAAFGLPRIASGGPAEEQPTIHLEIRYRMPEARRVLLMWGVNEWGLGQQSFWPAGTYVKDAALYTPMQFSGESHKITFSVPRGTVLDYMFLVSEDSEGRPVEAWEVDGGKPFRTICTADAAVTIESRLSASDVKRTARGHLYRTMAICGIVLLFAVGLVLVRRSAMWHAHPSALMRMAGSAAALWIGVTAVRLLAIRSIYGLFDWRAIPAAALSDLLVIAAIFLPCAMGTRRNAGRVLRGVSQSAWPVCGLLVLALAILNEQVIEILGRPFDVEWLYYSDFLRGFDWRAALRHGAWGAAVLAILLAAAVVYAAGVLLARIFVSLRLRVPNAPWVAVGAAVLYFAAAIPGQGRIDPALTANPAVFLCRSVWGLYSHPALFTQPVPAEYASDFRRATDRGLHFQAGGARPHNVVLVILESTPAEVVEPFGARYQATPELGRYAGQAMRFPNFYSHIPSSIKSMVCLMSSIYPWISYRAICREHPDAPLTALSDEFARRGYATSFTSSGNFQFGKARQFLDRHHFEQIVDVNNLECASTHFESNLSSGMATDGREDACMAPAFEQWIDRRGGRPFFAVLWTYQTHYPYCPAGKERDFGAPSADLNRYLNSLHDSDASFGMVMRALEQRGLADDTLVVAVGDHGETFGRHGRHGHASAIYDDQVHVPMMLINRRLFAGEHNETLGAHVDLAPTIFDVLGWEQPPEWQGRSMFAPDRSPRVYFFTPFADLRFGVREGDRTALFAPATNESEVFNLRADPGQMSNLARGDTAFLESEKLRMAAWIQHQNAFTQKLFSAPPIQ